MKAVHLAIDYQHFYLRSLNCSHRQRELFARGVRSFSNQLKKQKIPTMWVAIDNRKWAFYEAGKTSKEERDKAIDNLDLFRSTSKTLLDPFPKDDEDIFQKRSPSAFAKNADISLAEILKERNIEHIIVSGLYANACVFWTCFDAATRTDLSITVAANQIAKSGFQPFERPAGSILLHPNMIPLVHSRIEIRDKGDILRAPLPLKRQAPEPPESVDWKKLLFPSSSPTFT